MNRYDLRPDIRAMRHFIAGEIRSSVWNGTILPLCDSYIKSWGAEDTAIEHKCHNALWFAVDDELNFFEQPAPLWASNDDSHYVRRFGQYEAYVVEYKDDFWLSIFHRDSRIIHLSCVSSDEAMKFADTLFAGMILDGRCFDASHARKRE